METFCQEKALSKPNIKKELVLLKGYENHPSIVFHGTHSENHYNMQCCDKHLYA